jgi:hypothetical protein
VRYSNHRHSEPMAQNDGGEEGVSGGKNSFVR